MGGEWSKAGRPGLVDWRKIGAGGLGGEALWSARGHLRRPSQLVILCDHITINFNIPYVREDDKIKFNRNVSRVIFFVFLCFGCYLILFSLNI